jgi:hypothetical protein
MGEDKADELMEKADKRLKSGFSFFGGTQKFEDAVELYTKAGNSYKIAKKCMHACVWRIAFSYHCSWSLFNQQLDHNRG